MWDRMDKTIWSEIKVTTQSRSELELKYFYDSILYIPGIKKLRFSNPKDIRTDKI